jgi:hypothetical protein
MEQASTRSQLHLSEKERSTHHSTMDVASRRLMGDSPEHKRFATFKAGSVQDSLKMLSDKLTERFRKFQNAYRFFDLKGTG